MTDKELLSLAAKAIGLKITHMPMSELTVIEGKELSTIWNPLSDDGDALRLAMKLDLTICTHGQGIYVSSVQNMLASARECNDEDRPVLVRRTIVRAAAEIGKMMK